MFPRMLAFGSGGVLALATIPSIRALEQEARAQQTTIQSACREFRGTSAGAIIATLLSLSYNSHEIERHSYSLFTDLVQNGNFDLELFFTSFGGMSPDVIRNFICGAVTTKIGIVDATFAELYAETGVKLVIYAADLNSSSLKRLSHEDTPEFPVGLGVAASCCIPLVFAPVQFQTMLLVDGGLVHDLPLEDVTHTDFIMFKVSSDPVPPAATKTSRLIHFIDKMVKLVSTSFHKIQITHLPPDQRKRVLHIDGRIPSTTLFGVTKDMMEALLERGKDEDIMRQLRGILDE